MKCCQPWTIDSRRAAAWRRLRLVPIGGDMRAQTSTPTSMHDELAIMRLRAYRLFIKVYRIIEIAVYEKPAAAQKQNNCALIF